MIKTTAHNLNNNNNILYLFTIKSRTSALFMGDYKIAILLRNIKMFLREINKKVKLGNKMLVCIHKYIHIYIYI